MQRHLSMEKSAMQKTIRWAISGFTAGLLLTGTVAAASHNTGPAAERAIMAADKVEGTATQRALINFPQQNGAIRADGIARFPANKALDNANSRAIQLAAFTSGPNSGKLYVRVCGIVTCSIYYSHQATVQLAAQLAYIGSPANVAEEASLACSAVSVVLGAPVIAAGCVSVSIAAFLSKQILDTIDHAAATAGCVRFRSLDGINDVVSAVYADHSAICHSMDP